MDQLDSTGVAPYQYETDENGNIKIIPDPECRFTVTYPDLNPPTEPLSLLGEVLGELTEIKNLLAEILRKL